MWVGYFSITFKCTLDACTALAAQAYVKHPLISLVAVYKRASPSKLKTVMPCCFNKYKNHSTGIWVIAFASGIDKIINSHALFTLEIVVSCRQLLVAS